MCTSIVSNRKKVMIGWLPLFGANADSNFVAMPTCWPFDERSHPVSLEQKNIIQLDIDSGGQAGADQKG